MQKIGRGYGERFVELGSNHHLEVFAVLDKDGNETKWDGRLVSTYEAMQRLRTKGTEDEIPLVKKDNGPGTVFKFTLCSGEMIELDHGAGRSHFIVRTISQQAAKGGKQPAPNIEIVSVLDSRLKKEIRASGQWYMKSVNSLRSAHCRKVMTSPIGEVFAAHD